MQKAVVAALEDIKARDIVVLDVTHLTSLFDRVVIASADSTRQVKALAHNVQDKMQGSARQVEGEDSGEWVLVDLGAIVVHVMQPTIRVLQPRRDCGTSRSRVPREATAAAAQPAA